MRLRLRLRVSKAIPSPLPLHQQSCTHPLPLLYTPLYHHRPLIIAPSLGLPYSGRSSNYGKLPSTLSASCEPGLHDSSPLYLLLFLFERGGERRAAGFVSFISSDRSRPCISLVILLHASTLNCVPLALPSRSLAVTYFGSRTLLAPTLITLVPCALPPCPTLPALFTFLGPHSLAHDGCGHSCTSSGTHILDQLVTFFENLA